jgi:hypothetical protein
MGHGALGIGHGALGIGHWALKRGRGKNLLQLLLCSPAPSSPIPHSQLQKLIIPRFQILVQPI